MSFPLPLAALGIGMFLLATGLTAHAEGTRRACGKTNCTVYTVDLKSEKLELIDTDAEGLRLGSLGALEGWGAAAGRTLLFATNAGIFSETHLPLGLFIKNEKVIVPLNLQRGEGNFYLKPNGVFFISNKKARIVETARYENWSHVELASQSGPLLVLNGALHPAFKKNSQNLFVRSGVGVKSATEVLFALSDDVINFYDFASFFRDDLGCANALYLDGYISKMYLPELGQRERGGDFAAMFAVFSDATPKNSSPSTPLR